MIRKLRRLLLSAALGASVAALGCDKNLTEVEVPEAGVSLRYDLTPGQVYNGHVKWKNIIEAGGQQLITNLDFDVELLVTGIQDDHGPLLRAKTKNIKVNVSVPDGVPPEATGLSPDVAKQLNGVEIAFNADAQGKISNAPEPPEDLDKLAKATVRQLTAGVLAGLVRVPETQLKKGETWTPNYTRDGITTTGTGTFESMVQDETGASLAKLWLDVKSEGETEAVGTKMKVSRAQTIAVLFPTAPGFPTSIKRKGTFQLPMGDVSTNIEVTWARGEKRKVEANSAAEVQAITNPCDGDYVGPEECKEAPPHPRIQLTLAPQAPLSYTTGPKRA